jgi:hypothetical protein
VDQPWLIEENKVVLDLERKPKAVYKEFFDPQFFSSIKPT